MADRLPVLDLELAALGLLEALQVPLWWAERVALLVWV